MNDFETRLSNASAIQRISNEKQIATAATIKVLSQGIGKTSSQASGITCSIGMLAREDGSKTRVVSLQMAQSFPNRAANPSVDVFLVSVEVIAIQ
jgi:hypothetical protein